MSDAAELERRLAEWRGVASGQRNAGLALAALGVVAAVLRGTVMPLLPELVPVGLIVLALGLMGIGIVRRARYHWSRTREGR